MADQQTAHESQVVPNTPLRGFVLGVDELNPEILTLELRKGDAAHSDANVHSGSGVFVGGMELVVSSVYRIPRKEFGNLLLDLQRQFFEILEN